MAGVSVVEELTDFPLRVGRLDWKIHRRELVKEIQGAELMPSTGDSHPLPRLNHKCLCFMDLYKCAEDREQEAKYYR